MQENTVANTLLGVFKNITSDVGASRIITDSFYTNFDNIYIVKVDSGHYLYDTIISDCGPKHCRIKKPKLPDGEFVHRYCTLLMPMKILI